MLAELLLVCMTCVMPAEIDDWKVMPNRTIVAHIKGTPEKQYKMYWIDSNYHCDSKEYEPVPIKSGHIMLATGPVGTYMRWCYIIDTSYSLMTIENYKD